MIRLRKLVAFALSLWLLLAGSAAYALASLEPEHEREHLAMGQAAQQPGEHEHANGALDLVSHFCGNPGFNQLTSAWIAARFPAVVDDVCRAAPAYPATDSPSAALLPPPGPPPRGLA